MHTREAVERGVRKGVSAGGLNMENMDMTVNSLNFHDNKADAVVAFSPKGGLISQGVTMRYTLEQRGNDWVIVKRSLADMRSHTGTTAPGPGDTGADLPAGHPSLNGNPQ